MTISEGSARGRISKSLLALQRRRSFSSVPELGLSACSTSGSSFEADKWCLSASLAGNRL